MASTPAGLIGGLYSIDFTQRLEGAAPAATAFVAMANGQSGFMAVQVARGWPARARALSALAGPPARNLLSPLAHGPAATPSGDIGYFVICPAPPGPSLEATLRPWSETELIEAVLKPTALLLAELQTAGVTHRAIRASNLFQAAPGAAVTLGCAWAAPPASHQPSWVEPPYSACCIPAGRGEGSIADDVYALGALLLMLALGRNPVEGVPEEELLRSKLDLGSYAALVGNNRLPASIHELTRGMLADDPDHRPSPTLLSTPGAARARRIEARPTRKAQSPIELGGRSAASACALAFVLQREPAAGVAAIRNGIVDRWLRRGLGDGLTAVQLEEAVRLRDAQAAAGDATADPMLIANAIAVLDPAAPLVWRALAIWPDGLGTALDHALHHAPGQAALLGEIATANVAEAWIARQDTGRGRAGTDLKIRDLASLRRDKRTGSALWRLCYGLNPLTPCESPRLKPFWVTRLAELLPAMEEAAAGAADGPALVDTQIAAFIAARRDERLHGDIGHLAADLPVDDVLAQLRLAARLQAKLHPKALPNLCAWAAEAMQPHIQQFSSKSRRVRLAAELAALATAGQLPPMAALLDDKADRTLDTDGCTAALNRLAEIEQTLAELAGAEAQRAALARRIGQDIAGGLGVVACLIAIAAAIFT